MAHLTCDRFSATRSACVGILAALTLAPACTTTSNDHEDGGADGPDAAGTDDAPPGSDGTGPGGAGGGSGSAVTTLDGMSFEAYGRSRSSELDLVFVVDNSPGMGPKQELLADLVPTLIDAFTNPPCVGSPAAGDVLDQPAAPDAPCSAGARPFPPFTSIHAAVISSSLGGFGGEWCTSAIPADYDPSLDDRALPLGLARDGVAGVNDGGFLAWDNLAPVSGGPADATQLGSTFSDHVRAAGSRGCEFEAPLEAMYRFLVDPEPPRDVVLDPETNQALAAGIDDDVLAARASFLRPSSVVLVVMLSDENDCSRLPSGFAYLLGFEHRGNPPQPFQMPAGASICQDAPNDPCCVLCATPDAAWPPGCPTKAESCPAADLTAEQDPMPLRCFENVRRFGIDLLAPTSRYVTALTDETLCPDSDFGDSDCDCERATALGVPCEPGSPRPNPLFSDPRVVSAPRPQERIILAGLVGVPWQDLATDATRSAADGLRLLTARQLNEPNSGGDGATLWDAIAGWPHLGQRPTDPFMVEQTLPRSGTSPVSGIATSAPDASGDARNPANGHEWNSGGQGLQHACTFPLSTPLDCSALGPDCSCPAGEALDESGNVVDPADRVATEQNPLCQDPSSGEYGLVQHQSGAYPGLRQLEVLRLLGDRGVVGSACPKVLDASSPDYGYRPLTWPLLQRLAAAQDACLERALPLDAEGRTQCHVLEVGSAAQGCPCDAPGRAPLTNDDVERAAQAWLGQTSHECLQTGRGCEGGYCLCEVEQLSSAALASCQQSPDEPASAGYCIVDPGARFGGDLEAAQADPSWTLVEHCPTGRERRLRFGGPAASTPQTSKLLVCDTDG